MELFPQLSEAMTCEEYLIQYHDEKVLMEKIEISEMYSVPKNNARWIECIDQYYSGDIFCFKDGPLLKLATNGLVGDSKDGYNQSINFAFPLKSECLTIPEKLEDVKPWATELLEGTRV